MNKVGWALLCLVVAGGCATSGTDVLTPPVARTSPETLSGGKRILVTPFEGKGGECFTEEAREYLHGVRFAVVPAPGPMDGRQLEEFAAKSGVDLILAGAVEKFEAGSDTGTRRAAVGYFLAFIITAPIAGIYAASTNWKAFAASAAKMTVTDARSDETVWTKRDNAGLSAEGKSLSSEDEIKQLLLPRVCRDLVTKLLNDFLVTYQTRRR